MVGLPLFFPEGVDAEGTTRRMSSLGPAVDPTKVVRVGVNRVVFIHIS